MAVIAGVSGFMLIEKYRLLDAFYMTIITLSTVGFAEVKPMSDGGRMFASMLIIGNIGIFAYAISNISQFIIEGGLNQLFQSRYMERQIAKMKDHVIICGFGRYGKEAAEHFSHQEQPVVLVDLDEKAIGEGQSRNNFNYVIGDATHDEVLEQAGLERAKALIAALPEDADNLYLVLTARQINKEVKIVSRANYTKSERKMKRAGADHVIRPNQLGGFFMATLVTRPDAVEFFTTLTNKGGEEYAKFEEVIFDHLSPEMEHRTIVDLNIRQETGANVVGLKTPDGRYVVNPSPETAIQAGMGIIVLGTSEQIHRFKSYMHKLID